MQKPTKCLICIWLLKEPVCFFETLMLSFFPRVIANKSDIFLVLWESRLKTGIFDKFRKRYLSTIVFLRFADYPIYVLLPFRLLFGLSLFLASLVLSRKNCSFIHCKWIESSRVSVYDGGLDILNRLDVRDTTFNMNCAIERSWVDWEWNLVGNLEILFELNSYS